MAGVQQGLPWCSHCGAFYIDCDPAGGVACQDAHNLQVCSLDTRTKNKHAVRENVGRNTLGNLQAMLQNRFATHEVAICTEKVLILGLGAGIWFNREWLDYPLENVIQHLSGCSLLFIQPVQTYFVVHDCNW